jgi:hypothetical protein
LCYLQMLRSYLEIINRTGSNIIFTKICKSFSYTTSPSVTPSWLHLGDQAWEPHAARRQCTFSSSGNYKRKKWSYKTWLF